MIRLVLAAGLLLATLSSARADELTLGASRDCAIYEENGDNGNCAGEHLFAGKNNNGDLRRSLLHFDVAAALPAGATITDATLTLFLTRAGSAEPVTISLRRVLADWGEGDSDPNGSEGAGTAASPGDATWTHRFFDTELWTSPGGDADAAASSSQVISDQTGQGFSWNDAGMVSDLQGWLDAPGTNHGWLLDANAINLQQVRRFSSRSAAQSAQRPSLTIVFTPPSAAVGACCAPDGSCTIADGAGACSENYLGDDTTCVPNVCPQPPGACCAVDGSCSIVDDPGDSCVGAYQGSGTGCDPNLCPQPEGACCAADGSCTIVPDPGDSCVGSYEGLGSVCTPNDCPQPGACCLPNAAAECAITLEADCLAAGGSFQGEGASCAAVTCPVVLTPYLDPLPIPAVAQPVGGQAGGAAEYSISMVQLRQQLHSELPDSIVWGYDDGTGGSYPGPTIEASRNQHVTVHWNNELKDSAGNYLDDHVLPVDLCPHGAEDGPPKTVVHLHGGHVAAEDDGFPEDYVPPGESLTYQYPNWQDAATLWYHDHAMGMTRLNVYMGLAGFYLLRDEEEAALGLPSGAHEVPLVIQDRQFRPDGGLDYPISWVEHFYGDTILVNGKVWPFLDVDQGKYRFRLLNGSNSRTYTLSLSDQSAFQLIGVDGGLLESPVTLSELTLSPGERADVIIDFAGYAAGTELLFENSAPAPFPGQPGVGVIPDVMKFVVGKGVGHTQPIPSALRDIEVLDESISVMQRDFDMQKFTDPCTGQVWLINGLGWNDVTEMPRLGTTEVWRFINRSGMTHPMHMHLVFFQVLDRQPFEVVQGVPTPTGPAVAPEPDEAGWKDTVKVGPFEMVRVIARFEDFVGNFPYHCHILEHEDHEMMRQFQTVTSCGDGARGLPIETCDDGNEVLVDSCPDGPDGNCRSATCGDGYVWSEDGGSEECDDGGESESCDSDCTFVVCGDGVHNATAGEECDDGGESENCNIDCTPAFCGDGVVNESAGEECDESSEDCNDCQKVSGCGCQSSGHGDVSWLALGLAGFVFGRRRRRWRR